jgi:hypothetical protein
MKKSSQFASWSIAFIMMMVSGLFLPAYANDYYENQILRTTSKETSREKLREIQITEVALKSSSERLRLQQTKFFISKTKREIENRYAEGIISAYDFADIEQELRYLTYSMNSYFMNIRAFERSKNRDFQKIAQENLGDASQSYSRLKAATRKAVRTN